MFVVRIKRPPVHMIDTRLRKMHARSKFRRMRRMAREADRTAVFRVTGSSYSDFFFFFTVCVFGCNIIISC